MIQMFIRRGVHSVINRIEQTPRHWPSTIAPNIKAHPHTIFPYCEQTYYSVNPNEASASTSTRGHNTQTWTKHMHWHSSWAHLDNQTTFLLCAWHPDCCLPWHSFQQMTLKRQLVESTLSEKKVLSRTFKGSSAQRSAGTFKGAR